MRIASFVTGRAVRSDSCLRMLTGGVAVVLLRLVFNGGASLLLAGAPDLARAAEDGLESANARSRYFQALVHWHDDRPLKALETLRQVPEEYRRIEWQLTYRQLQGGDIICYGHGDSVNQVRYSPDGTLVASAGADNRVRIWDARTGKELKVLRGLDVELNSGGTEVRSLAFSPDGSLLAAGSGYGTDLGFKADIKLWDTRTWELVKKLRQPQPIRGMRFSPDGKRIAFTTWNNNAVLVWDFGSKGRPLELVDVRSKRWSAMAFSHDGLRAASVEEKTIKLWNAQTGEEIRSLRGHEQPVASLSFSPNGARLVSAGYNGQIILWDMADGSRIKSIDGTSTVQFTPDGRYVVTRARRVNRLPVPSAVQIWNLETGQTTQLEGVISSVKLSPDGSRLAGCAGDRLRLWDVRSGEGIGALPGYTGGSVSSIDFSPDGSWIVTGGADHTVRFWDARGFAGEWSIAEPDEPVPHTAVSPDGRWLATAGDTVQLRDASTGRRIRSFEGFDDQVGPTNCIAFSSDSALVAVAKDKTVFIWNVATGEPAKVLTDYAAAVKSVAFSPDNARLATGDYNLMLRIRDWRSGRELLNVKAGGHADGTFKPKAGSAYVHGVTFSPDGRRVASLYGSDANGIWNRDPTKLIRIWNATNGAQVATLRGHTWTASCVAFSSDSRRLVSGGKDYSVRLWDLKTGEESGVLVGHQAHVHSVAFTADGSRILSTGADETIRIWDVSDGEELKVFGAVPQRRFSTWGVIRQRNVIAVSATNTVLVATTRNRVRRWACRPTERVRFLKGPSRGAVSLSPDGKFVASGNLAGSIAVWDAVSGRKVATLRGHTARVRGLAFSSDNARLISASDDKTVKMWDIATAKESQTFEAKMPYVRWAVFHPDGKTIVAENLYDRRLAWDIDSGAVKQVDDWPTHLFARWDRSTDDRWLMKPFERHVLLVDVHTGRSPEAAAYLQSLTAADPLWHRNQATAAEEKSNWFAAAFHRAWELKLGEDSPEARDALKRARRGLVTDAPDSGVIVPDVVLQVMKKSQ